MEKVVNKSIEKGIAIPLLAIAIASIIAIVGLALDSMTAETAQQQTVIASEQAALAALYTFAAERLSSTDIDAILRASLEKANLAASLNNLITEDGSTAFGHLGLSYENCPEEICNTDSLGGTLIPGTWHAKTSPDEPLPACGETPCFEAYDHLDADINKINAFEVQTNTLTPLRLFFMQAVGAEGFIIKGSAAATIMPRHVVFLIDLSGSVSGDTHKKGNPLCHPGSTCYEHFRVIDDAAVDYTYCDKFHSTLGDTDVCDALYDRYRLGSVASRLTYSENQFESSLCNEFLTAPAVHDLDDPESRGMDAYSSYVSDSGWTCDFCAPCALEDDRDNPHPQDPGWDTDIEGYSAITKHYESDYSELSINWFDESGAETIDSIYVDSYSISDPDGSFPEPLFSILNGINDAVTTFDSRKVPGDMIGLLGFDHRVFSTNPSDSTPARVFKLGLDFQTIINATVTIDSEGDPISWPELTANENSFLSRYLVPAPHSFTDGKVALNEALGWFDAVDTPSEEQKKVILFTDGMFNCDENYASDDPDRSLCHSTNYYYFQLAHNSFETGQGRGGINAAVEAGVSVDIIGFGNSIKPHYTGWCDPDNPDEVISPEKMRMLGWAGAHGWQGSQTSSYKKAALGLGTFHIPNHLLWNHSTKTGGMYYPIREMEISGMRENPGCIDYMEDTRPGTPGDQPAGTEAGGAYGVNNLQIFAPEGVTKQQQIQEALKNILGPPPIILVK